eukprot:COSAG01_NODE_1999_length_8688_cov_6.237280_9_plen_82_part_00
MTEVSPTFRLASSSVCVMLNGRGGGDTQAASAVRGGAAGARDVPQLWQVSQNGWPLSRRGRSSPASAGGSDTHRDSMTSRF